jgi:hypothetical protein
MSAFSTSCFILPAMDGKIKQCVCIKLCVKLCKSTTETPEMLHEASGEHSLSWTAVFEWHSRFKAGRVQLKMTNAQLWSLPGDLYRIFEHALHCDEVRSPTLDKPSKAAACKHVF